MHTILIILLLLSLPLCLSFSIFPLCSKKNIIAFYEANVRIYGILIKAFWIFFCFYFSVTRREYVDGRSFFSSVSKRVFAKKKHLRRRKNRIFILELHRGFFTHLFFCKLTASLTPLWFNFYYIRPFFSLEKWAISGNNASTLLLLSYSRGDFILFVEKAGQCVCVYEILKRDLN